MYRTAKPIAEVAFRAVVEFTSADGGTMRRETSRAYATIGPARAMLTRLREKRGAYWTVTGAHIERSAITWERVDE